MIRRFVGKGQTATLLCLLLLLLLLYLLLKPSAPRGSLCSLYQEFVLFDKIADEADDFVTELSHHHIIQFHFLS